MISLLYKRMLKVVMPVLLLPMVLQAQNISNLTLNQIWALADSNNRKIEYHDLKIAANEAHLKANKAERLPEMQVDATMAHVFNLPIYENGIFHAPTQFPVDPKYYKIGGDTYFNLYNGGKSKIEILSSKVAIELSKVELQQSKQEVHFLAAVYFLDIYRNLAYKALLDQDIFDRKKQLAEINQLFKNGTVLKSDVLRAELRLSKQLMLLTEIDNSTKIAQQKLNALIGWPENTPINLQFSESEINIIGLKKVEEYVDEALEKSLKFQMSEKEQELSKLELKKVKSNNLPSIGLFAAYAYAYPQIQLYPYSLSLYSNGMAGLKLKIPISSWYTNQNRFKEAALKVKQHEVEDQDVKDQIRQEVQEHYIRYKEFVQRIKVAEENIKQATESYRIIQNTYFNQLSLLTDLLDAETQLLQSKFELTTAKVNAKMQYYQLQKTIGNL